MLYGVTAQVTTEEAPHARYHFECSFADPFFGAPLARTLIIHLRLLIALVGNTLTVMPQDM